MVSLALYFLMAQVSAAATPRYATRGAGPAHATGSVVSIVTTTRNAITAPSGVNTRVRTVFGCSLNTCLGKVRRVKKKSRTMLRRQRSCCLNRAESVVGTVVQHSAALLI